MLVRVNHVLFHVPWVLAGSIPTELGELINMTHLLLQINKLNGNLFLLI